MSPNHLPNAARTPPSAPRGTRYVIEGEPVSGKNSQQIRYNRKTGGRYIAKSKAAAAWQVNAVEQLVKQRGRTKTLRGKVRVDFIAYQKNERRDIDNIAASVFDALKKALVIEDDRQIMESNIKLTSGPDVTPRIEITLQELVLACSGSA